MTTAFDEDSHNRDASGKFAPKTSGEPDAIDLTTASTSRHVDDLDGRYGDVEDRDERLDMMKADLHRSVMDVVNGGELRAYLDARRANRANHWSAQNQFLAASQLAVRRAREEGRDATSDDLIKAVGSLDCGTVKQWNERGRKVVSGKGSALYIYAPVTRWITEKDKETGEERKKKIMVGVRPTATFDVSQTDGDPVPEAPGKPFTGKVEDGTVEAFTARANELGYTTHEREIPGCDPVKLTGTLAYVSPESKELVVDSRLSDEEKSAAMAHELGHIECGHVDAEPGEYRKHRGSMETEAEAFSYMMMRERGASIEESEAFSPAYIAGWSKGDSKLITKALENAGKAFSSSRDAMFGQDSTV